MKTILIVAIATTIINILASVYFVIRFKQWKWWTFKPMLTILISVFGWGTLAILFYIEWYWFIALCQVLALANLIFSYPTCKELFDIYKDIDPKWEEPNPDYKEPKE